MAGLTLLSLNCFGALAPGTHARLRALAQVLDQERPDVACLQEVQLNRYLRFLRRHIHGLPNSAHEPFLHAPKGGLLTLSRHAIESSKFTLFRHRGALHNASL